MIDPRTTNLIGAHVLIRRRDLGTEPSAAAVMGRGVVRVVDNQQGCFLLLIETVGTVNLYGGLDDGSLFQVSLYDETTEILVDRDETVSLQAFPYIDPLLDLLEEALNDHTGILRIIDVCRVLKIDALRADHHVCARLDRALRALGWEALRDRRAYVRGTLEQRTTCLGISASSAMASVLVAS